MCVLRQVSYTCWVCSFVHTTPVPVDTPVDIPVYIPVNKEVPAHVGLIGLGAGHAGSWQEIVQNFLSLRVICVGVAVRGVNTHWKDSYVVDFLLQLCVISFRV